MRVVRRSREGHTRDVSARLVGPVLLVSDLPRALGAAEEKTRTVQWIATQLRDGDDRGRPGAAERATRAPRGATLWQLHRTTHHRRGRAVETTLRAVRRPGRVPRRPHPTGTPGGRNPITRQRQEAVGQDEPRGLTPRLSAEPAKYALEVNEGLFDKHGVQMGDGPRLPG